ncbi:MAG: hypothetical protein OEZ11_07675 [Gammaproteobacteria bacterium]|nr:hypothetical protein [Gammaproteobacteria bacterium]
MPIGRQLDRVGLLDGRVRIVTVRPKQPDPERDLLTAVLAARPHFDRAGTGQVNAAVLIAPVVCRVLPCDHDPVNIG